MIYHRFIFLPKKLLQCLLFRILLPDRIIPVICDSASVSLLRVRSILPEAPGAFIVLLSDASGTPGACIVLLSDASGTPGAMPGGNIPRSHMPFSLTGIPRLSIYTIHTDFITGPVFPPLCHVCGDIAIERKDRIYLSLQQKIALRALFRYQ